MFEEAVFEFALLAFMEYICGNRDGDMDFSKFGDKNIMRGLYGE